MWFFTDEEQIWRVIVSFLLVLSTKTREEEVVTIVAFYFAVDILRWKIEVLAVAFAT